MLLDRKLQDLLGNHSPACPSFPLRRQQGSQPEPPGPVIIQLVQILVQWALMASIMLKYIKKNINSMRGAVQDRTGWSKRKAYPVCSRCAVRWSCPGPPLPGRGVRPGSPAGGRGCPCPPPRTQLLVSPLSRKPAQASHSRLLPGLIQA